MPKESIRLIQISDTHLFADPKKTLLGCHTYKSLMAVINLIEKYEKNINSILLTGDLSQDETPESYQHVIEILKPFKVPIYWIPGNHDDRKIMHEALKDNFNNDKHLILDNWLIILADSLDEGKVSGLLNQKELERIKNLIAKYPKHYLALFIHHPPFKIHSTWIDNLNLKNADEFLNIVKSHPHLRLIASGHIHQEINAFIENFLFLTCPSTSIQFRPFSAEFALDHLHPGYRWIELNSEGTIISGIRRAEDFQDNIDYSSKGY